ncbi:hypothetical protein H0N96_03540 [Candidatus Micrarchaeota archaeon]|nr:hypothetical protein [Candidatus Micrarchaeota archaeon]
MNGKRIIVPGEVVFDSPKRVEGTFIENGKTFASTISVMRDDKFIPLKGKYLPKLGDLIVGIVKEEKFSGYVVDINSPYEGQLSARESRETFELADVLSAEIIEVNEVHEAVLGRPHRLWEGEILDVEPVKVPRIIGRNASMLNILRQYSKSDITVGKNGRVYLKGGDAALATLTILKICREAHLSGLTDRITAFLESETVKK